MMQKALVCAFFIAVCRTGAPAAADAPQIEKQFARLDSTLSRCARLSESRMKEIAPFDKVAQQVLASCPEIAAVMRTNSKGIVVNCLRRASGESELSTDASTREWYTLPKATGTAYYGRLRKENRRSYCIWSRPLSISTAAFGSRFSGVVAVSVDITVFFNRIAAEMREPFQVMLDGKSFYYLSWNDGIAFDETPLNLAPNLHFSLKLSKKAAAAASQPPGSVPDPKVKADAHVKAQVNAQRNSSPQPEPEKQGPGADSELTAADMQAATASQAASSAERTGKRIAVIFKIAGVSAVILAIGCLWLVISTVRKRRPAAANTDPPPPPEVPLDLGGNSVSDPAPEPAVDAEENENHQVDEIRAPYQDIPPILPFQGPVMQEEPPAQDATEGRPDPGLPAEPAVALTPPGEAVEAPGEAGLESPRVPVSDAAVRREITDEQRNEIYKKELEALTVAIRKHLVDHEMPGLIEKLRSQFAAEMHQHIAQTMSAEIEEKERLAVHKEVAEKIREEEYDSIAAAAREDLSASLRSKLAEEESARFFAEARETLKSEINKAVRDGEEDVFRAQVREEMAADVRCQLTEQEKESIAGQQRRNLEAELYAEVSGQSRDAIRESVLREITEEERQRMESGLRQTIIDDEKRRIIAEEAEELRRQIRSQLRAEELETLHRTVRDEIYSETIQTIKRDLEEKYQSAVDEKITELRAGMQKKARADIGAAIREDYERLMEQSEKLSASLTNIEALQSLDQTVTLLTDEKKKYKYLNLNTAQTESLLEYLRRVHHRFNIFFDKVDESLRELMLNLGSVKNKLDNKDL
jgi:hypothetical protein